MRYRSDIDGLRAVAVLLVLVFHFKLLGSGDAGFMGVDIFFVISGYLISRISWHELEEHRFSFAAFYVRRVRRLAPPLFATQALVVLAAWFVLMPPETTALMKEVLASQFYVSNIFYWRTISYFGFAADRAFMLHTWSLAVEEQFYLFFPLFLVLVHRWRPRALPAALVLLFAGSFALDLAVMHWKPQADFYLLPTRAWEFAVGALIPVAAPLTRRSGGATLSFVAAIALIVLALALYTPIIPFPGWFALLPTLGAAAAILAGENGAGPSPRALGWRPLVFVGRISYSLYLVHWPIRVFAGVLLPDFTPGWRWACFALSLLLATIFYFAVEQPVRRGRLRLAARGTTIAYAIGLASIVAVAGSALASEGWAGRFSPRIVRIAAAAGDRDPVSEGCEWRPEAEPPSCAIGVAGTSPTWLLYGDSHAAALRNAFSIWLAGRGESGIFTFQSGCLPVPRVGDDACRAFNRHVGDLIARSPDLRNVAIASTWRQPLEPGFRGDDGTIVTGEHAIAAFSADLHALLLRLNAEGRRIVVWEPVPGARMSVPLALARRLSLGHGPALTFSRADYDRTFGFLQSALDRDQHLIARRIRPAEVLCRTGVCAIVHDGKPLYNDNAHPAFSQTPFYARIIARGLAGFPAR